MEDGRTKAKTLNIQLPKRPAETASPTRQADERSRNVIEIGRKFASCSPLVRIKNVFFYFANCGDGLRTLPLPVPMGGVPNTCQSVSRILTIAYAIRKPKPATSQFPQRRRALRATWSLPFADERAGEGEGNVAGELQIGRTYGAAGAASRLPVNRRFGIGEGCECGLNVPAELGKTKPTQPK